jgi:hypothetical protein
MNKNVEHAHGKVFYAHVGEFKGVGEEKLILHEATIGKDGSYHIGDKDTLVIDPSSVTRIDRETPDPPTEKTPS